MVKGYEVGYFINGFLFDHVRPDMRICEEEIFGHVLCAVRVNSMEEGMKMINDK